MEQQEEFFQEFKHIYSIDIPINKSELTKENEIQKFLFYIDLTNDETYSKALAQLSTNIFIHRYWQGGILSEFQINNRENKQSIFCYYFNKLIQQDEQINIQNFFRFRIFLQDFISTQKNYQIKFVFHFRQKQLNQKDFEDYIIKCIYQILEGSFDVLNDIIFLYNQQDSEIINYCKISKKKINFQKSKQHGKFDSKFIETLDQFLNYFQFKKNDPNLIGYKCQNYVQDNVNVVLKVFEEELIKLQKDISLMIEFPVNLNNEINENKNVQKYLDSLKTIMGEIYMIFKNIYEFDEKVKQIHIVLNKYRNQLIKYLSDIVNENSEFQKYLKLIYKDKSPDDVFNQLLQFKFELVGSDNEVLQKLKKYNYNQDSINATLMRVIIDIKFWFEQFNLYLPQSLAYLKRMIISQNQNINQDKPHVFVLGMTRVGKSTLLNILKNPENIIVNQNKNFDVKVKDNNIVISDSNNSETFLLQNQEIDNFIFVDSPGLRDTSNNNRVINHYKTFIEVIKAKQQIFLLMIDGEELIKNKNDLIDSIEAINLMLGKQNNDNCLQNLILPVFTKIKNDTTMEKIKNKWQSDTMKDIKDQFQLKILNIIKKAIDEGSYFIIYIAENYEIEFQKEQLDSEIKTLKDQALKFYREKEYKQAEAIDEQINLKEKELNNLQQVNFLQNIKQIKDDLLKKCEKILKARQKNGQSLNFEFNLTPGLQDGLKKLLPHRKKFYKHILNIIKSDLIAKMLYDDTKSINDKFKQIFDIYSIQLNKLSDIPQNIITQDIQQYIEQLDTFNKIISESDDQNQYLQKDDFQQFKNHLRLLKTAFRKIPTILKAAGLKQIIWDSLSIKHWKNESIFKTAFSWSIFSAPLLIVYMELSAINLLFTNNVFVTEQEKKKLERLNLLKFQQEYWKNCEKSK
ncbi:unnamed protein product [Paramecium pentaurelia]|uniref:G domain-containing protein n=1 Tax=Paramecium pentaurelia TaxID=43138 RepID=A0A8S1UN56_9CILI|nr:unnamed protein product [Paramecium pentaurelia]